MRWPLLLVLVIGGEGNAADPNGIFPQAEWYDLAADRWESAPQPNDVRHGTGAAALDGVIYLPGGANRAGFGAISSVEAYCP